MTERQFYRNRLRPALHDPPRTVVFRVEDYGMPDVIVVSGGQTTYFELKTLEHLPVREGTPFRVKVTPEQRRTLSMINETFDEDGYHAGFILVAVARERRWYLFTPDVPDEIDDPERWAYIAGSFDELGEELMHLVSPFLY